MGRSDLSDFSFRKAAAIDFVLMYLTSRTVAVVVVRALSNFGPDEIVDVTLLTIAFALIELLRVIGFVQWVSTRGFTFFKSIGPWITPADGRFSFSVLLVVMDFFIGSTVATFGFGARFAKSPNAGRRVSPAPTFFAAKPPT